MLTISKFARTVTTKTNRLRNYDCSTLEQLTVEKCLPQEVIIEGIDDIMYSIGLSFKPTRDRQKRRNLFNNPIFILMMTLYYCSTRVILITMVGNDQIELLLALGDYGHFFGLKNINNMFILNIEMIILSLQLVNYYNYKRGIESTFVRVFQMMSGLITPESIGLFDINEVIKLVNKTRILMTIAIYLNKIYIGEAFLFILTFYYLKTELSRTWFYMLHCSINLMYFAHIMTTFIVYQFIYFYIICKYLKIKINNLNQRILKMKTTILFTSIVYIPNILFSFDELFREIANYNATYWSKFLFIIWFYFGFAIILVLYISIFSEMVAILKFITHCLLFEFAIVLWFTIFTAASVNTSVNKSYKLFNTFYANTFGMTLTKRFLRDKLKLDTLVCRIAKKKVGFSCGNLFVINTFRSYGVIL